MADGDFITPMLTPLFYNQKDISGRSFRGLGSGGGGEGGRMNGETEAEIVAFPIILLDWPCFPSMPWSKILSF